MKGGSEYAPVSEALLHVSVDTKEKYLNFLCVGVFVNEARQMLISLEQPLSVRHLSRRDRKKKKKKKSVSIQTGNLGRNWGRSFTDSALRPSPAAGE